MQWSFLLRSAYQPRVESRILQVLDHHMLKMESFSSMRMAHDIWITFVLRAEQTQVTRIYGLFGKLQNIKRLHMFCQEEAITRTTAVIKVWCDQESRLPIIQVLSSINARTLTVRPLWMAFEVTDSSAALANLYEVLCPYGIIESLSAASLVVHTDANTSEDEEAESRADRSSEMGL
jgi:acetolactate synthase small subunit